MHYTDATKNYMVSRSGRVWSLISNKWIKPYVCRDGYQLINLKTALGRRTIRIHRLVLETYVGPCPEGMEACHNNGDSFDNRLENLRWDTRSANNLDAVRHGTASGLLSRTPGEKCGRAKLRELDVRRMRYLRRAGVKLADLATVFGISASQAGYICSGKSWSHI